MLAEIIKKARLTSCLTQEEMADCIDVSKSNYLRKEKGLLAFERDEVPKLARILNLNENEMLAIWKADGIYLQLGDDKILAKNALDILVTHLDDYETCVLMPNKSDSYSTDHDRLLHRIYK